MTLAKRARMSKLFSNTVVGSLALQNHLVMSPLTRSRAIGNIPNELMAEYYSQRASLGLLIAEGTSPSPNGLGYARIPGMFSAEQVEGWKLVTQAVHAKGAKMFVQLMHCGRIAHPLNLPKGARVLAPSAVAAAGEMWTDAEQMKPLPVPHAMTEADIKQTIDEFVLGAKNAIAAGFDGVELHSANGYLLEQFLRPELESAYGWLRRHDRRPRAFRARGRRRHQQGDRQGESGHPHFTVRCIQRHAPVPGRWSPTTPISRNNSTSVDCCTSISWITRRWARQSFPTRSARCCAASRTCT